MASGNHISCGPCMFDDVTKDAGRWCTSCEEGLCEECEKAHRRSKSSRNHQVISIEDYRKIENVSISQICEQHSENLMWFCKSHDEVLCVVCVPLKHKTCTDVIPISANSANTRQSSALFDLEETIEGTLRNVKQCIKNRESATKEIEKQELAVKTMVLETRTNINGKLDKLQEKLLQELRSASLTCKSEYMKIFQKLKSTEERLIKLKKQTIQMKQFSSEIQVFLGTRQVKKRIVSEIDFIKSEISTTKDYDLKVSIHSLIEKLSCEVEDFGKLMVSESATNLDFRDTKFDQAQMEINIEASRNISDIELQLIKTCQMKKKNEMNITGCVILPNGHILIANYTNENCLIECTETGEHIRDIPVSGPPYDISVLDLNRICVSYGDTMFIEIMNCITYHVEKKISLQNCCLGVSQENGRLYVLYGDDIEVMDLSGQHLDTVILASKNVLCIKTRSGKIYYADYKTQKVHCRLFNGEELWQLKRDSINFCFGVTVDNYHNVYVVGYVSDNLTIIQHDGKDSKTLLTKSNGMNCPQCVHFDKDTRTLVIGNKEGLILLYKVV